MNEYEEDFFQGEVTRAISSLQHARSALMLAAQAATVRSDDARQAWKLALLNTRSALLMACTISVIEAGAAERSICIASGSRPL